MPILVGIIIFVIVAGMLHQAIFGGPQPTWEEAFQYAFDLVGILLAIFLGFLLLSWLFGSDKSDSYDSMSGKRRIYDEDGNVKGYIDDD